MKFRGNTILQYSLVTFAVVAAMSVVFPVTLTREIADYQIRSHVRLYPEIVRITVRNDPRGHFDPLVVGAFLKREKDFRAVSEELADEWAAPP